MAIVRRVGVERWAPGRFLRLWRAWGKLGSGKSRLSCFRTDVASFSLDLVGKAKAKAKAAQVQGLRVARVGAVLGCRGC